MLIFLVLYSFYRKDIPTALSPLGGLTSLKCLDLMTSTQPTTQKPNFDIFR